MAVIQDEQGNNKPIKTDTSHVFDVNGNPLHGELFIGETIASDDVEEIDGYAHESDVAVLHNNVAGSNVDLLPYSASDNKYVFPYDGYVQLNGGNNSTGNVRLVFSDATGTNIVTEYMNITGQYQRDSLFVRKGMMVYCNLITSGSTVVYVPLVSVQ